MLVYQLVYLYWWIVSYMRCHVHMYVLDACKLSQLWVAHSCAIDEAYHICALLSLCANFLVMSSYMVQVVMVR